MNRRALIGAIGLSFSLTGCVVYEQGHAHESPYNDRYEEPDYQSDVRVAWGVGNYYYDPYLDLYVSYGFPSSYWLDGFYFRYTGDIWLRSARWHGPWVTVGAHYLPRRINTFRDYYSRYPKRYPNKIRLDAYRDDHANKEGRHERKPSHEYRQAERDRSNDERHNNDVRHDRSEYVESRHYDSRHQKDEGSSTTDRQAKQHGSKDSKQRGDGHKSKQERKRKKASDEKNSRRETRNEAIRSKD